MTTTVINLIGGPGITKSTLAADIFSSMKKERVHAEMVREVAKDYAWEGKSVGPFEQLAILGEQIKRESMLFGKVDYIITDSPVLLGAFYLEHNHNASFMNQPIQDYYAFAEKQGVTFHNYLLNRIQPYDPHGRFESEEQAKKIDKALNSYLLHYGYHFKPLKENSVQEVRDYITIYRSI